MMTSIERSELVSPVQYHQLCSIGKEVIEDLFKPTHYVYDT